MLSKEQTAVVPSVAHTFTWISGIVGQKNYRRAGSCNFPTDSYKFPTEETMGAKNFNFSLKVLQI